MQVPQASPLRKAGNAVILADDAVQSAIRKHIYGEAEDGTYGEGTLATAKALIAHILHGSGDMLSTNPTEAAIYLAGTRGLQAGAAVGAAHALAGLAVPEAQDPGQLRM